MSEKDDWVGPYRLLNRLGTGGAGTVWEGAAPDGVRVAVKILHPYFAGDEIARKRLVREIETMRAVNHPRVAPLLDYDVDGESPYLVTQLIEGPTLEEDLRDYGPLPGEDLLSLAEGIAQGLEAIHAEGIVHRDLKPSNVMLAEDGPVIIDFGISQLAEDARYTKTGNTMGTAGYLAPEQYLDRELNTRADHWAWAAILARCTTGREPFGAGLPNAVSTRVLNGDADLEGMAAPIRQILRRALNPDPAQRPPMRQTLDELTPLLIGGAEPISGTELIGDVEITSDTELIGDVEKNTPPPLPGEAQDTPVTRALRGEGLAEGTPAGEPNETKQLNQVYTGHTRVLDSACAAPVLPAATSVQPPPPHAVTQRPEQHGSPVFSVLHGLAFVLILFATTHLNTGAGMAIGAATLAVFAAVGKQYIATRREQVHLYRSPSKLEKILKFPFRLLVGALTAAYAITVTAIVLWLTAYAAQLFSGQSISDQRLQAAIDGYGPWARPALDTAIMVIAWLIPRTGSARLGLSITLDTITPSRKLQVLWLAALTALGLAILMIGPPLVAPVPG